MSVSRGPRDLKHTVFAKGDGTHVLALWLDRRIYDPREQRLLVRDLQEPIADVRLDLGSPRDLEVQHLTKPGSGKRRDRVDRARINLTAGVTLVTLR